MTAINWGERRGKLWSGIMRDKTVSAYRWMINRCYNERLSCFQRYGAKGIKVCSAWLGHDGFGNFKLDMGDRPSGASLDRIDNQKGYSRVNCRWVTRKTQSINQGKRMDNVSGYFGVYWETKRARWRATIKNDRKTKFLGYHKTAEEAARAYDVAARELHGSVAKQNFKQESLPASPQLFGIKN